MCEVICASLPTVPITAAAAFPLLSTNNRQGTDGITAVRRRGPHLDPWRCVGIVPAERYEKRVHAIFAPPAPLRSPQKARSGQTAGRVCATFKAHTKKPRYTENICTSTKHNLKTSLTHTKNGTLLAAALHRTAKDNTPPFTMSSRVINPNKQTAHDAVRGRSPEIPPRRNLGWRSAGKRDRPASDATLARKIGQRCASRRVQTRNNSEKEEPHGREQSRVFAVVEEDGTAWNKKHNEMYTWLFTAATCTFK